MLTCPSLGMNYEGHPSPSEEHSGLELLPKFLPVGKTVQLIIALYDEKMSYVCSLEICIIILSIYHPTLLVIN